LEHNCRCALRVVPETNRYNLKPARRSGIPALMKLVTGIVVAGLSAALLATRATPRPEPARVSGGTVVLELFTSQGCSSCPPADRLLSRIGAETFGGTVIPLSFHVDYWNYLGWRDPFSSAQWSARQKDYARVIGSQVYTPQLVVDGASQLVGSSERHVRSEIARRLEVADAGAVVIDAVSFAGDALHVQLHAKLPQRAPGASLVVVLFENGVTTRVTSGENTDRTLTNDFIARSLTRAADVHPAGTDSRVSLDIPIDPGWRRDRLGIAAYLQDPETLEIRGGSVRMAAQ
jgi:hypothetical protein